VFFLFFILTLNLEHRLRNPDLNKRKILFTGRPHFSTGGILFPRLILFGQIFQKLKISISFEREMNDDSKSILVFVTEFSQ
jgi:hypothetical protein